MAAEKDAVAAIIGLSPYREALSPECHWDLPEPTPEADVVLGGRYLANDLTFVIFDLGKSIGHGPRTWAIAAAGDLLAECLVWTIEVIDLAPAIEGSLYRGEVLEALEREDFCSERPVKTFVLASAAVRSVEMSSQGGFALFRLAGQRKRRGKPKSASDRRSRSKDGKV